MCELDRIPVDVYSVLCSFLETGDMFALVRTDKARRAFVRAALGNKTLDQRAFMSSLFKHKIFSPHYGTICWPSFKSVTVQGKYKSNRVFNVNCMVKHKQDFIWIVEKPSYRVQHVIYMGVNENDERIVDDIETRILAKEELEIRLWWRAHFLSGKVMSYLYYHVYSNHHAASKALTPEHMLIVYDLIKLRPSQLAQYALKRAPTRSKPKQHNF